MIQKRDRKKREYGAYAPLRIADFHPKSSSHRPCVTLRMNHNEHTLWGCFTVDDNYIVITQQEYNSDVWRDSCVELFLSVPQIEGYFNFEFSAGGAFRIFHIRDHERVGPVFRDYTPVSKDIGSQVEVKTTLPPRLYPPVDNPQIWELHFAIPLTFFTAFHDDVQFKGLWRGNVFKCAGDSSHPHWGSWNSIGEELNFHQPDKFGEFHFLN